MMELAMYVPRGILLPESVLYAQWFSVLASFVAINTVIYLILGITKILPPIRFGGSRGRERRSETRSIDPDAPV
ncbi:hypothetical protein ACPROK_07735 [Glutamicibacter soli]|uniref:hypothetical protein n=1 Tax=Micrococcaceae TaxID=1268 RepID=UPI000F1904EA|nr:MULTISPECIES: hypothetical protein [unclassified Arthrobacter]RKS18385.1 hypothetical protein DFO58_2745 [Arthrobacter sp. AG1021]